MNSFNILFDFQLFISLLFSVAFKLRPETAYLYDAVWIYARAAHEAIQNGESPSNGTAVFQYMRDTTYHSKDKPWI